jgi:hypothetical protein
METENYETSSESVSNFMRWIERRLEQEVTANETYAKTTKSSKPSVIPPQAIDHTLSELERLLVIKQVDSYRNNGYSVVLACKLTGLHTQTYNKWRKALNLSRYKRS